MPACAKAAVSRTALLTDAGRLELRARCRRWPTAMPTCSSSAGVAPEQRVIIALPDGPDYVAALFGILKIGAVVVMVNPELKPDAIEYFFEYSRAAVALVAAERADAFRAAAGRAAPRARVAGRGHRRLVVAPRGRARDLARPFPPTATTPPSGSSPAAPPGGPRPPCSRTARSSTPPECYAGHVLRYTEDDVTLSVPKLYFGYAMGSNLLFPFAAGATSVLFEDRCTAGRHLRPDRPAPADHPDHRAHDDQPDGESSRRRPAETSPRCGWPPPRAKGCPKSCTPGGTGRSAFRFSTGSAPRRCGTSSSPIVRAGYAAARWARWCPASRSGWRTRRAARCPTERSATSGCAGGSRALGYWQQLDKSQTCFRGEWVVTGDLVRRDPDGYYSYGGRADELLKVSGKWLSATEVEGCLLQHPAVSQVAVVGVTDANGLVKPHAWVVPREPHQHLAAALADELKAFVRDRLEPYKCPREVIFVESLPTTHLGKVDRGRLRAGSSSNA